MSQTDTLTDAELTRLAAEKVMGWKETDFMGKAWWVKRPNRKISQALWSPLTDWRAAGEIVEKMRENGWYFETKDFVRSDHYRFTRVHVERSIGVIGGFEFSQGNCDHPSSQRAITIASLLAVGAITEDQL